MMHFANETFSGQQFQLVRSKICVMKFSTEESFMWCLKLPTSAFILHELQRKKKDRKPPQHSNRNDNYFLDGTHELFCVTV